MSTGRIQALQPDVSPALLDALDEGVYFLDPDRRITFWNRAAERITGYTTADVLGQHCSDNILEHVDAGGRNLCKTECPASSAMQDGKAHDVEVYLRHKRGHRVSVHVRAISLQDAHGRCTGAIEIFREATPTRTLEERVRELESLAVLDPLTGLANRRYIESAAGAKIDAMDRYGWTAGILFIDLDDFKQVNDTYGHDVGDRVLRMVGATLTANSRSFDVPGRWGGEEFVVLCENVDLPTVTEIAQRYRSLIAASKLNLQDAQVQVTVSIGATLAKPKENPLHAIARADRLMYRSKRLGKNRVQSVQ